MNLFRIIFLFFVLLALPAAGQSRIQIAPETTSKALACVKVSVPGALSVAISDSEKLLIVGTEDGKLLTFDLEATQNKAEPLTQPKQSILLSEGLSKNQVVTGTQLALHPTQPILYVWQNIAISDSKENKGEPKGARSGIAIYRISSGRLHLVSLPMLSESISASSQRNAFAVAIHPDRLYLPCQLEKADNFETYKNVRWIDLDANGLPQVTDKGLKEIVQTFQMIFGDAGPLVTRSNTLLPSEGGRVLIGSTTGANFLDTAQSLIVQMKFLSKGASYLDIAKHPKLPMLYFCRLMGNDFFAIQEGKGIPSQMPQIADFQGVVPITHPVVMPAQNKLAMGVKDQGVLLLGLTKEGWLTGKAQIFVTPDLSKPPIMAWSEAVQQLYLIVP